MIVVGGANFRAKDIFAFGEKIRQLTKKDVDAFETREVNKNTEFYERVMKEGGCADRIKRLDKERIKMIISSFPVRKRSECSR